MGSITSTAPKSTPLSWHGDLNSRVFVVARTNPRRGGGGSCISYGWHCGYRTRGEDAAPSAERQAAGGGRPDCRAPRGRCAQTLRGRLAVAASSSRSGKRRVERAWFSYFDRSAGNPENPEDALIRPAGFRSMTIRTAGQLDWFLDQRLSWRKRELTGLKFATERVPNPHSAVVRRAALALLYAHWEGFIKEAGSAYVELVARQRKTQGELSENFVAVGRRNAIREAGNAHRISPHIALVRLLRTGDGETLNLPWKKVVRTRSNLKFDVLEEVLLTLGLDLAPYRLAAKPVIDALVKRRNGIAHGEGLPVTEEDYQHFHDGVVRLLDTYRDQLSDAAAVRAYTTAA
jgi:hypothetical protein